MSKAKFEYYEVVKICSDREELKEIYGKEATVLGIYQDGENLWSYVVSVKDDYAWDVTEQDLESLGRFAKKEDFYTGESITVGVNEKGEGYIKDYKFDKE